jgi:hypothetical protein
MDLEELSKSQLLLLMLLVNFITSIATGVLTVSLLDEAPTTVTQTVNQIVDHTIETVATGTPLASIVATPPPTKTTTVVQQSAPVDPLPAAIAADIGRTVEIYGSGGTTTPLIASGTYLPKTRAVVTATQTGLPVNVTIVFANNTTQTASISHLGATIAIYGFGDSVTLPAAATPTIVNHTSLQAGESVVAITDDGSAVTGIISKIDDAGVHTNLPVTPAGNSLVDLSGNIVGISTGTAGLYYAADKITTLLTATSTPPSP